MLESSNEEIKIKENFLISNCENDMINELELLKVKFETY